MSTPPARCPVCGQGTVADIAYDADPPRREPAQRSDSRELLTYSCGHEVVGDSPLSAADEDRLDVERRSSEETVDPPLS
ncbi:MAG: hypothetical protein ACAH81_11770 [Actinomycetota bacterium]|jgi:hypothetical protein